MKNEAKKTKNYEALCQVVKLAKYLSPERRGEMMIALHTVPNYTRDISINEVQEWLTFHQHREERKGMPFGVCGGNITKTECYTSVGTMTTYLCQYCHEQAYVDDDPEFG